MSFSTPTLGRTLISITDTRPAARAAWSVLLVAVGVVFLALSAQVAIPIPPSPVPITGQTLSVLLIGAAYGSRLGPGTVLTYIFTGVAGAPVFAGWKFGVVVLAGPTGGYLLGFVIAAWVVGMLAERAWDRSPWLTIAAMTIGSLVIYACGAPRLAAFVGWDKAIALGVVPFLIGDAMKIIVAAAALPGAWRLKERGLR